jgi:serine protease Do
VIKIGGTGHPHAQFADSDGLKAGQFVIAIGTPFGLDQTVTLGIVSARGRRGIVGAGGSYEDFIQTDVAINPGNSGGPLVNLDGKVVGINSAIYSRSGGYQGIGFAIPSNLAKTIMERLVKVGYVERAWLGVVLQDVTPDLAPLLGLARPEGVVVSDVFSGSPAARVGLRPYDVVVSVAGREVRNSGDLRNRIAHTPVGEKIEIKYVRDGRRRTARPRLAAHPRLRAVIPPRTGRQEEGPASSGRIGVKARPITAAEAEALEYPDTKGLVVLRVYAGGAAAGAGIERGDVILEAGRVPLNSNRDLERAKEKRKPGEPLLLRVRSRTETGFVTRLVTLRF